VRSAKGGPLAGAQRDLGTEYHYYKAAFWVPRIVVALAILVANRQPGERLAICFGWLIVGGSDERRRGAKSSVRRIRSTEKNTQGARTQESGDELHPDPGKTLGAGPEQPPAATSYQKLEKPRREMPEEAVHVRDLETPAARRSLLIAYRAIIDGYDLAGIDRCLRIMERRSKLLGSTLP